MVDRDRPDARRCIDEVNETLPFDEDHDIRPEFTQTCMSCVASMPSTGMARHCKEYRQSEATQGHVDKTGVSLRSFRSLHHVPWRVALVQTTLT